MGRRTCFAILLGALGASGCNAILGIDELSPHGENDAAVKDAAGGGDGGDVSVEAPDGGDGGDVSVEATDGGDSAPEAPAEAADALGDDSQASEAGGDADAHANDASSDADAYDASGDEAAPPVDCDAGPGDAGTGICPGGVVYVSRTGSNGNSGCSPCAPKLTIAGAIAQVQSAVTAGGAVPAGFAIHVCAGAYPEALLTLSVPVSLRGGYDCSTWVRPSDSGWPTFGPTCATPDAGANPCRSVITNGSPSLSGDTLVVNGTIDRSTVIDGFTVRGQTTEDVSGNAIVVTAGAPTLSDLEILGGGSPTGYSVGVSVGTDAEIVHDRIHGGSGAGAWDGASTGIDVVSGSPYIHDNEIDGGPGASSLVSSAGSTPFGAFGILVQGGVLTRAAGAPIEHNVVRAGGTAIANQAQGAGIAIYNGDVEVLGNEIHGPSSSLDGVSGYGVLSNGGGARSIRGNRIDGGSQTGDQSAVYGIVVRTSAAVIANNFIYGGRSRGAAAAGVHVGTCQDVQVQFNTIFGPVVDEFTGAGQVLFADGAAGAHVDGNILAGASNGGTAAVYSTGTDCTVSPMLSFTNNLVVNDLRAVFSETSCGNHFTIADAEANVRLGTASGNLLLSSTCSETACLPAAGCGAPGGAAETAACLSNLFTSFGASDYGFADLFPSSASATPGWRLQANLSCKIAQGGKTLVPQGGDIDFYGTLRTAPRSMGAHEIETCQ